MRFWDCLRTIHRAASWYSHKTIAHGDVYYASRGCERVVISAFLLFFRVIESIWLVRIGKVLGEWRRHREVPRRRERIIRWKGMPVLINRIVRFACLLVAHNVQENQLQP